MLLAMSCGWIKEREQEELLLAISLAIELTMPTRCKPRLVDRFLHVGHNNEGMKIARDTIEQGMLIQVISVYGT